MLATWAQILREVKGSHLLLLGSRGSSRSNVCSFLSDQGIESSRVEFVEPRPRPQYLQVFHRIDISLDTFPYNGHTTSLDSLWMGVPVVTLVGDTAVSRAGWCHLSNLQMTELVGHTTDQYVSIAEVLAADPNRLSAIRSSVRGLVQQSRLMDSSIFVRQLESAYRQSWQRP
jgi:predicted O-linked N-acetylglucosamine transferase (SPINDLY family)